MKALKEMYCLKKAKCCKCGCTLSTDNGSLGDYFVLDNNGNYYCTHCDGIFKDGDERIYVYEEEEKMETIETMFKELEEREAETRKAMDKLQDASRKMIIAYNNMLLKLRKQAADATIDELVKF